jgi:hypothetical protein
VVYLKLKLTALTRTPGQPDSRTPVTVPPFPSAAPDIAYMSGVDQPTDLLDRLVARSKRQPAGGR